MTNKSSSGLSYGVVAILVIIAFALGAGVGVGGFIFATGGEGRASRSVQEAIAEAEGNDSDENDVAESQTVDEESETDETTTDEQTVDEESEADETTDEQVTDTEADDSADATSDEMPETSEAIDFAIVTEQSSATFTLEEDLRGERVTVIGTTEEVGGTISVNLDDPTQSSVGTIAVNVRTIATDNDFRNRAIRSRILKSAQEIYEFVIFEPTALSNFSAESVSVGDILTFDITGNLTITGVTQEVTFNASVTVDSDTQISGTATSNVLYADFGLVIPEVPSVANVTDDIDLAINFVAMSS